MKNGTAGTLAAIAAERAYLVGFAARRLRNPEQSEDVVQSALAAAVSAAPRFAGRSSVRTWLTAILRNAIADAGRARRRDALLADPRATEPAAAHDPAEIVAAREIAGALGERLGTLPRRAAAAFVMREIEGRPSRDIRAALDLTPSQYWQALHRSRQALRAVLDLPVARAASVSADQNRESTS